MTEQEWLGNNQLSLDIWNKKYRVNQENFDQWLNRVSGGDEDIKRLIREKKFLFGGRILSNRGTNRGAMSNCNSLGYIEDSLTDIMQANTDLALTYKAQGGQGLSLSKLRPKGTLIHGNFHSDGIIPFMEMFNTTTKSISQGGNRRGALLMALDIWHKEALEFAKIKSNMSSINNANLSLEVDDKFMQIIENYYKTGKEPIIHIKREYSGNTIEYDVEPVKLYKEICNYSRNTAEPGILFIDRMKKYNLAQNHSVYKIECTNACSEIPMTKHGACILGSINLSEYVSNPYLPIASIDLESLIKDISIIVRAMDDIVTENQNLHVLSGQAKIAETYRNVGIGIMGLNDLFVKLSIKYGSPESIRLANATMNTIFRHCIYSSIDLAKIRGNFPGYESNIWDSDIIKENFIEEEIGELKKTDKLRNLSLVSIAPTGSIGTMLGVSTGAESYFALSYNRKTVSLNGDKDQYYKVDIDAIREYKQITGNNTVPDFFVGANDIPWKERIDMQAALQLAVDQAISSTCNLPKTTTSQDIEQLYLYAWKRGLKGVTIFVDGCREPILSTDSPKETKKVSKLNIISPIHRDDIGQVLTGNTYKYHTACGTLYITINKDKEGNIVEIFTNSSKNGTCKANLNGETRLASLALRAGVKVSEVADTLKSIQCQSCAYARAKGNKIDGTSCPDIIAKCIIKDIKLEKSTTKIVDSKDLCPECKSPLEHVGGCIVCPNCSWSKCD